MAERQPSLSLGSRYLIGFNFVSTLLWAGVLASTLFFAPQVGPKGLFAINGEYTKWTQTLAILEVIHVVVGLARSSLPTTALQVASRILLVWGVCDRYYAPQHSVAYTTMLVAWGITEVCRYPFYIVSLSGGESKLLQWLRYNTFFVLYPLGAGSEAFCIYRALAEAKIESVPYYWVLVAILATYPPGLYNQYTHMIRQRRKSMRGKKKA
ncbi:tyrosine phosphatase-like protein [Pyronema omphalodes]|nr:tyrosine phosphatase-like protein [Pyronema omphalodes]